MHLKTEEIVKEILKQLTDHGVKNYAIAISDPDSNADSITFDGSPFWLLGVGQELVDRHRLMNRISFGDQEPETEV